MAYTKNATWVDHPDTSTLVTADKLNNIEDGIEAAASTADGAIPKSLVDTKGDLLVATAADTVARLAVGTDNHVLAAASGETPGVKYVYVHALPQTLNAQTDAYTLVAGDAGKLVTMSKTAAMDLTIPKDVFSAGQRVDVLVINTGMVTVKGATGVTVTGTPSLVSRAQWSALTVICTAANTFVAVGDLATP